MSKPTNDVDELVKMIWASALDVINSDDFKDEAKYLKARTNTLTHYEAKINRLIEEARQQNSWHIGDEIAWTDVLGRVHIGIIEETPDGLRVTKQLEDRPKAKITKIGKVIDGCATGWEFDCGGMNIPALDISGNQGIIAGYTVEELAEISKQSEDMK